MRFSLALLAASLLFWGYAAQSNAAEFTWNGGSVTDDNLGTATNWVGGTAPTGVDTDVLIFTGTSRLTPNNNLDGATFGEIRFSAGGFTLGGKPCAVKTKITNNVGVNTVNVNLTFSGNASVSVSVGTKLIVDGTIDLGVNALINDGAGTTELLKAASGTGKIEQTGGGVLRLKVANAYSGGTTLSGGAIEVGATAALGSGTLTVSGNGTLGSDTSVSGNLSMSLNNTIVLNNASLTLSVIQNHTLTLSNTVSIDNNKNISNNGAGKTIISGAISGAGKIIQSGGGLLRLKVANDYSGGTTLSGGVLEVGASGALGSNALAVSEAGGKVLGTDASISGALAISLSNGISVDAATNLLLVAAKDHTLTLSGSFSGNGALRKVGAGTAVFVAASTLAGGVQLDAGTLQVEDSAALGTGNFKVAGAGVLKTGAGGLVLTNNIQISSTVSNAPDITSAKTARGLAGSAFTYTIAGTNAPTGYNATDLPPGLSVNTGTGVISGTPTNAGEWSAGVGATNGSGTGTAMVVITIKPAGTPVVNSALSITGTQDTAFSHFITATNTPTSFTADDLPPGLSINTTTGEISGTATASGWWSVPISATNSNGTWNETLKIIVKTSTGIPVITNATSADGTIGNAFSFSITAAATVVPSSYAATNLPPGLSVNTGTGAISGTPTTAGQWPATVKATNGSGTGEALLIITINNPQTATLKADIGDYDLTLSGTITGEGGLEVIGCAVEEEEFPTRKLTVSHSGNTYGGGTRLTGGNLTFASLGSPTSGMMGLTVTENSIVSVSENLTFAHDVSIGSERILQISGANNLTLNGKIGGGGELFLASVGTVRLNAANALTDRVRLISGTVEVNDNLAFGSANVYLAGNVTLRSVNAGGVNLGNRIIRWEPPLFDGNDAVALCDNAGNPADVFGIIGNAPAAGYWGSGENTTKKHTLRRNAGVNATPAGFPDGADITDQWDVLEVNNDENLGAHSGGGTNTLIISEIVDGTRDNKYVEIYNGTAQDDDPETSGVQINLKNRSVKIYHDGSASATAVKTWEEDTWLEQGQTLVLNSILRTVHPTYSLTIDGNDPLELSGTISGRSLNLIKSGSGKLTVSGDNGFIGDMMFHAGTLALGSGNALGEGELKVGGGGAQELTAATNGLTVNNPVVLSQPLTIVGDKDFTLNDTVSGAASLTKDGSCTLTLKGSNTYAGGTAFAQGQLTIGAHGALGTGALTVSTATGCVLLAGPPIKNNANVYEDVRPTNAIVLNGELTVDGDNNLLLAGVVSGSSSLIKDGAGRLSLLNGNSYDGDTILKSGTLLLGHATALGDGTLVVQGGSLGAVASDQTLANTLSLEASFGFEGAPVLTLSGNGALTTDLTVTAADGTQARLTGNLSESSARTLTVKSNGGGILRLGGDNGFTNLRLESGVLEIAANSALGLSGGTFSVVGGTLRAVAAERSVAKNFDFSGTIVVASGFGLTFNGPVALTAEPTLTVHNHATLAAGVTGASGLTLSSASSGTLFLSGAGTYAGATKVNGGTLHLNSSGSLATQAVVGGQGTLAGTGSVQSVDCAGTLSPAGDAAQGVLTVVSDLTFRAGSTFKVQINGTGVSDGVTVGGAIDLGPQFCALAATQTNSVHGTSIRILDNGGGGAVSGYFVGLPEGAAYTVSGRPYGITYAGGDGDDVYLSDNRPPVAQEEEYATTMNPTSFLPQVTGLNVGTAAGVLRNASDPDGDVALAARLISGPTNNHPDLAHAFKLNADGSFVYTPVPGFFGLDAFTYAVKDAYGTISPVYTATIRVNDVLTRIGADGNPQDVTVDAGAQFSLKVDAVGQAPLRYQWYRGASPNESDPVLFEATALTHTYATRIFEKGKYRFWVKVSNTVVANGKTEDYSVNSLTVTVTVRPAPLAYFAVEGFATPTAVGESRVFHVTAKDAYANTLDQYAGTVTFSSTDPSAELPAPGAFSAADNGSKNFSAVFHTEKTVVLLLTDAQPQPPVKTELEVVVNNPPVFSGSEPYVTATPNPAVVGQTTTFSAAATDKDALTWTWDFGDGRTVVADEAGGERVEHVFSPAGTYVVKVRVTDAVGQSAETALSLEVRRGVAGPDGALDSDGDGFSDELEIALGTSPFDASETPWGGLSAGDVREPTRMKLDLALDFKRSRNDRLKLTAVLPANGDFIPADARVLLVVGGVVRDLILDEKGKARTSKINASAVVAKKTGAVNLNVSLRNDAFADFWADEGLLNADVGGESRSMGVTIFLNDAQFQSLLSLTYKAKKDRSGKAR